MWPSMNSHPSSREKVLTLLLGFDAILKNGIMTKTHPLEDSTALVDYVIAGYKTPMVFVIHFYVDWERQTLIGPKEDLAAPVSDC